MSIMMKDGKSIVLIGMPGVGKSTIGVILAKEIGYQFLDADLLIQEQEGMLLKDIIATKGHDGFLAVENQVNRDVDAKHSVIATGGSAVKIHARSCTFAAHMRFCQSVLAI